MFASIYCGSLFFYYGRGIGDRGSFCCHFFCVGGCLMDAMLGDGDIGRQRDYSAFCDEDVTGEVDEEGGGVWMSSATRLLKWTRRSQPLDRRSLSLQRRNGRVVNIIVAKEVNECSGLLYSCSKR